MKSYPSFNYSNTVQSNPSFSFGSNDIFSKTLIYCWISVTFNNLSRVEITLISDYHIIIIKSTRNTVKKQSLFINTISIADLCTTVYNSCMTMENNAKMNKFMIPKE